MTFCESFHEELIESRSTLYFAFWSLTCGTSFEVVLKNSSDGYLKNS
ncbi:hypothetical protein FGIG_03719 [Fasciola gigantica]|uniref:Uncharacterized protein n=1 Tax=Fasciola gigantica TaxID=46835 RepID=A0A504YQ67_FASGI|nr:hypothetical protein FGIG_03719 [Fasciola gigantica]